MNKQKIMKWALPALLMSAMTFELMPGSVSYHAKENVVLPEATWNFFSIPVEGTAASCVTIAGVVTFVALALALVATCMKKSNLYKTTGWCSLAAAALASVPYMMQAAQEILIPNVMVVLILTACWLLAMQLDKKKEAKEERKTTGRRL